MKLKKTLKGLFAGLLVFVFFGCASTPSSSNGKDLNEAVQEAALQMEARIPAGTTIALVSVASPSTAFSTQVLTRLESALVSNGKLIIVDRANLDKVREEQGFQLSGDVDDESAKSIGKLLGAGAIVTGSLTDLGDVYSLTLKAINIETATVAVSYLADLTKTPRINTLLASRDGIASSGTSSTRTQTTTPASTSQATPATPPPPVYNIGDTGPAGGIIFYDKGNNSGGWRYLEAAPASSEFRAQFGRFGSGFGPNTRDDVGGGKENTQHLKVTLEESGQITMAIHRCTQLNINGYTDWFLPSKAELGWMYINLKEKGLGGFSTDWYWSSSKGGYAFRWWSQRFSDGTQSAVSGGGNSNNMNTQTVRAIRQF